MASSIPGRPSGVRVSDLAIFPWHSGALLPAVALERMTIERLTLALVVGCGRSSAMSRNISWNICRGIATSAIWKATWRPWLTTFAPILIGFSFRLVSDQSLIGWASPACAGNFRGCRRAHEAGGARRWPRTF